ncbi:MAG: hypothetical protein ABI142_01600, partial [Bryocella sp.]
MPNKPHGVREPPNAAGWERSGSVVKMLSATVEVALQPVAVMLDGLKTQDTPAGKPVQENVIAP